MKNTQLKMLSTGLENFAHSCNRSQRFLTFHSFGGITGFEFGSLPLERLSIEHGERTKPKLAVHPAPKVSSSVLEQYNAVLAAYSTIEYADCSSLVDDEAVNDIRKRSLDILRPAHDRLDRLIGQVVSSVMATLRLDGALNIDLAGFRPILYHFQAFTTLSSALP